MTPPCFTSLAGLVLLAMTTHGFTMTTTNPSFVLSRAQFGTRVATALGAAEAASNSEEDLELTRQLVLGYLQKTQGGVEAEEEEEDEAEVEAEAEAEAEVEAEDEAEAEVEAEDEAEAEVEAEDEDEAEAEVEAEDEDEAEAEVEAEDEDEAEAEVEAEDEDEAEAEVEAEDEAEAEVEAGADVAEDVSFSWADQPENDTMLRAAKGEAVANTPVWLFRQAGRHLPEYQAYKAETNRNFLELLDHPESVAECTMQPLRRYPVDAAILFSDILVVPQSLGVRVTMPGGVGIQVPEPLTSPEDLEERSFPDPSEISADFVHDKLGHVIEAVTEIRRQMASENKSIPLIGFSAAPWTLMYYMVGGSSKKNTDAGVRWLTEHTAEAQGLLDLLTKIVIEYLAAQLEAGAHLLQIFEAMGMMIDDDNFRQFALPCLDKIGRELKARYPDVPLMVFARGACGMNPELAKLGVYDVVTMDGSVDRATARSLVQVDGADTVSLQGNYDPAEIIAENEKTVESVRATTRAMLEALGPERLIANLGEGLGGKESPELVLAFVDAVHEISAEMMAVELEDAEEEAAVVEG